MTWIPALQAAKLVEWLNSLASLHPQAEITLPKLAIGNSKEDSTTTSSGESSKRSNENRLLNNARTSNDSVRDRDLHPLSTPTFDIHGNPIGDQKISTNNHTSCDSRNKTKSIHGNNLSEDHLDNESMEDLDSEEEFDISMEHYME